MARNSGDRTCVRNINITDAGISNTQAHNEREKKSYVNPDIVPERSTLNVHYKTPSDDYTKLFGQMEEQKTISTRGLKPDAIKFGELVFDVNSAYFYNHGGYEYARRFYEEAYRAAVEIVGGEQYILSAVMHADERNRAMSEKLGEDVYHYHLHVVYVPVVEKQILWSKRCKDPALRGLYRAYLDLKQKFERLTEKCQRLEDRNETLHSTLEQLQEENTELRQVAANYNTLCRGYGLDVIAKRVKTITEQEAAGRVHHRASNRRYEAGAR